MDMEETTEYTEEEIMEWITKDMMQFYTNRKMKGRRGGIVRGTKPELAAIIYKKLKKEPELKEQVENNEGQDEDAIMANICREVKIPGEMKEVPKREQD